MSSAPSADPLQSTFTGSFAHPLESVLVQRQLTINDIIDIDTPPRTSACHTPRGEGGQRAAEAASEDKIPHNGCCAADGPCTAPTIFSPATTEVLNAGDDGDINTSALKHYFVTRHPHRHCSVDELLDYNRKWSTYMNDHDPQYFKELAKHQAPKFLWIGCADSRVPANEILGLAPGDVFVHRNVANVVYPSDLNCLACIQFGVEQLRIEHLIISGHYECGGVKASYYDLELGLVDNWVANIRDIKHRYWKLIEQVPETERVATLCEINAIVQARHVAESTVVQRWWAAYRREQGVATDFGSGVPVTQVASGAYPVATPTSPNGIPPAKQPHHNVVVHGWIYGLADGLIVPLVDLTFEDDVQAECDKAIRRCVAKRVPELRDAAAARRKSSLASPIIVASNAAPFHGEGVEVTSSPVVDSVSI